MAESIANAVDEYLVSHIKSQLGLQSSYTTMQVEHVIATAIHSERDWDGWPKPAVVIVGTRTRRDFGGYGDGIHHYDKFLIYRVSAIVEAEHSEVTAKAKTMEKRLELAMQALQFGGIAADDGEHVQQWAIELSDIMVKPKVTGDKVWYGFAIVDLAIKTHI